MKFLVIKLFILLFVTAAYAKVNVLVSIAPQASFVKEIGGHFEEAWIPRIKNQSQNMEILDCSYTIKRIDIKPKKVQKTHNIIKYKRRN